MYGKAIASAVLRLAVVLAFVTSTYGKFGRIEGFSEKFGIPVWLGHLVLAFEIVGLILLVVGLFSVTATRVGAVLLGTVMVGTFFTSDAATFAEAYDSARLPIVILGVMAYLLLQAHYVVIRRDGTFGNLDTRDRR